MVPLLVKRYDELLAQAKKIEATRHLEPDFYSTPREQVDYDPLLNWKVKAKSLLIITCGADSVQFVEFTEAETGSFSTSLGVLKRLIAVFAAAKEDYEGGYLTSERTLVQAEVFSSELDQASELLTKGYHAAAAVIAGVVLETHLQEISRKHGVPVGKIEAMNAELVKKTAYNVLRQKQITAHADLRNKAAHGKNNEFSAADVKAMIADIARFLADA